MRFWLLDRICSFEPDTELTAVKNVSLAEEYLADHFPDFPVLPGVFMLEAATQAMQNMRQGKDETMPDKLRRYKHAPAYHGVIREPLGLGVWTK